MSVTLTYPDYQNSDIDWLGKFPSHWDLTKLKHKAPFQVGWTPPTKNNANFEGNNLWANISDLKSKVIFDTSKKISDDAAAVASMEITPKGSLLYSFKLSVGSVAFAGENMYTNEAIASFLQNNHLPLDYLYYAFPIFIIQNAATNIYGARILNQDLIKNAHLLAPSFEEASQIATFLDYETGKIDRLIEKQEQLIALLKEKRQAVISHAVTKGLNPAVPMRHSGVEWLGEVPAHWSVSKLKWRTATTSGGTPPTSKFGMYYESGDIPWIRTMDLNNSVMFDTPISITPRAVQDTACSILPVNSVLLAMYGGAGSIGKHALLKFKSTINQAVAGILPCISFDPRYLHSFYEFYRPFWMIGAAGTRKDPNIGQDHIKEAKLPCPPLDEQVAIAEHLDRARYEFNVLSQKADEMVALLKERRTALISAAVTGKIDVRGWQPPHPNLESISQTETT